MKPVVLLVEDNPTDEKLTMRAFAKCSVPHDIVIVRDGAEALDYILGQGRHAEPNLPDLPSLILLDLKLPRIDGLEVVRRIRADERAKTLPIVILTASREEEDVLESRSLGANAYVRKPVDFTQFVEAANIIGLFWLRLNEPGPRARGSV
jgi:two-component system, response regulator